jgi:hypothetical protein
MSSCRTDSVIIMKGPWEYARLSVNTCLARFLFDINLATAAFSLAVFVWHNFFHPFPLTSPYVYIQGMFLVHMKSCFFPNLTTSAF